MDRTETDLARRALAAGRAGFSLVEALMALLILSMFMGFFLLWPSLRGRQDPSVSLERAMLVRGIMERYLHHPAAKKRLFLERKILLGPEDWGEDTSAIDGTITLQKHTPTGMAEVALEVTFKKGRTSTARLVTLLPIELADRP